MTKPKKKAVKKNKRMPVKPPPVVPDGVLPTVLREVLNEMQSKFTELYNLSKKTNHKLLYELAVKVFERLKLLQALDPSAATNCVIFSQFYRKSHPHSGDFQIIVLTLHDLQNQAGVPRAIIEEENLKAVTANPYLYEDIPHQTVHDACHKYTDKVLVKVKCHINKLKSQPNEMDTKEEAARKKVRGELKKMVEFMPSILSQIAIKHFIPYKAPHARIWMYGEPKLPAREWTQPFLNRFHVRYVRRSFWMYNHLRFNVPPDCYADLMAADGTDIDGSTLVIRNRDAPRYSMPEKLLKQMMGNHLAKIYMDAEKKEYDHEQTAEVEDDDDEEEDMDDDEDKDEE